jgi:dihydrofolate reductase
MGRVVYMMNVSLDGYVETLDRSLDWGLVDEELHTWFNDRTREAGAQVYGRRLYEVMSGYWPTAESDPSATPAMLEFARLWNQSPKIVFSSTLESVIEGCRLERGDPVEVVERLRGEIDGNLDIGGPTLASALIGRGMVDEFRAVVHPVILGAGRPFLPQLEQRIRLRLVETRRFESGVVALTYQPA